MEWFELIHSFSLFSIFFPYPFLLSRHWNKVSHLLVRERQTFINFNFCTDRKKTEGKNFFLDFINRPLPVYIHNTMNDTDTYTKVIQEIRKSGVFHPPRRWSPGLFTLPVSGIWTLGITRHRFLLVELIEVIESRTWIELTRFVSFNQELSNSVKVLSRDTPQRGSWKNTFKIYVSFSKEDYNTIFFIFSFPLLLISFYITCLLIFFFSCCFFFFFFARKINCSHKRSSQFEFNGNL